MADASARLGSVSDQSVREEGLKQAEDSNGEEFRGLIGGLGPFAANAKIRRDGGHSRASRSGAKRGLD